MNYDHIALIFNPNSTGDAPRLAKSLANRLMKAGYNPALTPTARAGHAEELAYDLASKYSRPLIISVSGDGGYHEVVNGAMRAKTKSRKCRPVVAVAAAGNANDHRRVVRSRPLLTLIKRQEPRPIDLLRMSMKTGSKTLHRYAHSYIGFGVTPEIALELNRHTLNRFKEIAIVLRAFWKYRSFSITHNGATRQIDSLIFANINEMAKVIKFKNKPDLHDNQFEVVEFAHEGRLKLLHHLLKAAIFGLRDVPSYQKYEFWASPPQSVQSDGEIETLTHKAHVVIESVPAAIESLY